MFYCTNGVLSAHPCGCGLSRARFFGVHSWFHLFEILNFKSQIQNQLLHHSIPPIPQQFELSAFQLLPLKTI